MGRLLFRCPVTHEILDSKLWVDRDTVKAIGHKTIIVNCQHCGIGHSLLVGQGRVTDEAGLAPPPANELKS